MKALLGEPVRVTWDDATGLDGGWVEAKEITDKQMVEVVSIGHLVAVTTTAVYMAMDRQGSMVNCTGIIPIRWLKRVEHLVGAPGYD